MRHRLDAVLAEQLGEQAHRHLAVLEHVAHAAGHAQVVFEHVVGAAAVGIGGAHDVDAGDLRIDIGRHVDIDHFGAELGVALDLLGRHDAGLEDRLLVIDVVDEAIERRHALSQAALHLAPFVGRDDARDEVERDQALGALVGHVRVFVPGAVHGKRDADAAKDHFGLFTAGTHDVAGLLGQPARVAAVMRAHHIGRAAHLVECLGHDHASSQFLCHPAFSPSAACARVLRAHAGRRPG